MEVSGLLVSLQPCVQHAQTYSVREHVSCSVMIPLPQFTPRLRLQRHARRSLCPRRINIQERLRQYTTTCCTVDCLFATAVSGTKKQARFSTFRISSLLPVSTATTLVPATAFSLLGSAAVSELVSSRHPEGCLKLQIRSCRCSAQNPQRLPRHSEKRSQSYHGPQGYHLLLFPPLAHCARDYHTVGCFPVPKLVQPQGLCTGRSTCQEDPSPGISTDCSSPCQGSEGECPIVVTPALSVSFNLLRFPRGSCHQWACVMFIGSSFVFPSGRNVL